MKKQYKELSVHKRRYKEVHLCSTHLYKTHKSDKPESD